MFQGGPEPASRHLTSRIWNFRGGQKSQGSLHVLFVVTDIGSRHSLLLVLGAPGHPCSPVKLQDLSGGGGPHFPPPPPPPGEGEARFRSALLQGSPWWHTGAVRKTPGKALSGFRWSSSVSLSLFSQMDSGSHSPEGALPSPPRGAPPHNHHPPTGALENLVHREDLGCGLGIFNGFCICPIGAFPKCADLRSHLSVY